MLHRLLVITIAALAALAVTRPAPATADDAAPAVDTTAAPAYVVFETTAGEIVMEVHPGWSPLGTEHFLELVAAGFYDGAPWFRVIDGFVAQCGIAADPALNDEWGERNIKDEPVVQGNLPGYIAFGKSMQPDSRSTHIYINYADNSRLDSQGFSCFARVVSGMDAALSLHRCEYNDQQGLSQPGGLATFQERFPEADYILRAYTIDGPGQTGTVVIRANCTGADVWFDGEHRDGVTPLALETVFPGRHLVTCRHPDGRELSSTVDVQPGKTATIRFLFADRD